MHTRSVSSFYLLFVGWREYFAAPLEEIINNATGVSKSAMNDWSNIYFTLLKDYYIISDID